jgi:hypothetical protein
MVEVPKNKSKSAVLETVVVAGLFMSAFYFLFFEEIDEVLKKYGVKEGGDLKESDNNTIPAPTQPLNPEQYEGRTEYCSDNNNPDSCVRGFPMPNSIDDLNFADNGRIRIITKPFANPFGLPEKAMVSLYRSGDKLAYNGRIDGVKDTYIENYNDVKDEIALVNNTYLNIN